jgi:hypothetical protein
LCSIFLTSVRFLKIAAPVLVFAAATGLGPCSVQRGLSVGVHVDWIGACASTFHSLHLRVLCRHRWRSSPLTRFSAARRFFCFVHRFSRSQLWSSVLVPRLRAQSSAGRVSRARSERRSSVSGFRFWAPVCFAFFRSRAGNAGLFSRSGCNSRRVHCLVWRS